MSAVFTNVGDDKGILAIRAATYNGTWADTTTNGIKVLLWDSAGTLLPQQYEYPQYAMEPGSYIAGPAHLTDEYADVRLPVRFSIDEPLALDYLALRRDSLQPFSFSVVGKPWFASCSCSQLQHDTAYRQLLANVTTDVDWQDWWGCFVLPDTSTVATLFAVDTLGDSIALRSEYDYTVNPASAFNCITVRIEPQYAGLHLKYTPSSVAEGKSRLETRNCELAIAPNPFTGAAEINYSLPKATDIALRLYDVSGALTKVLAQGPVGAGRYTMRLDARKLARGIYFIKFEAAGHRETRKLIIE